MQSRKRKMQQKLFYTNQNLYFFNLLKSVKKIEKPKKVLIYHIKNISHIQNVNTESTKEIISEQKKEDDEWIKNMNWDPLFTDD